MNKELENELNIDWSDWDNKQKLKQKLSYQNTIAMASTIESLIEIIYETRAAQAQTNQTMGMMNRQIQALQDQLNTMIIKKMGSGPTQK